MAAPTRITLATPMMMPSSVRKLRSLWTRMESRASHTAVPKKRKVVIRCGCVYDAGPSTRRLAFCERSFTWGTSVRMGPSGRARQRETGWLVLDDGERQESLYGRRGGSCFGAKPTGALVNQDAEVNCRVLCVNSFQPSQTPIGNRTSSARAYQ